MSMSLLLADAAQHVVYLAGVSGDGTNNGAITNIANRVLGGATVVIVAIFGVKAAMTFAKGQGGAEGHKALMHTGGQFVIAEGLVFAAWSIARIGMSVFGGAAG